MKKLSALLCLLVSFGMTQLLASPDDPTPEGFIFGNPEIQSINAMAFSPEGILFIGDSKHAAVFAIKTNEQASRAAAEDINMSKIDETIAAQLGVHAEDVSIRDMAVHPVTKAIYLAVQLNDGKHLMLKTSGESFENVALNAVNYSKVKLSNPIGEETKDRRGRSQRGWAISDLAFFNGQVMVSGLSNEEFSSTFRTIPFPFKDEQSMSSLEIFHAAHGRYETYAPIKTFMPYELDGEPHLIASYTCTPLVIFPLNQLKPGKHTKGKTVAELGNRNTPLDIISYKKDGKEYLLMANSSRALMKIDPVKVSSFEDYLTEPVKGNSMTAGVQAIHMPYVNVQQLDDYNDEAIVMIQRKANGNLDLMTVGKNRL